MRLGAMVGYCEQLIESTCRLLFGLGSGYCWYSDRADSQNSSKLNHKAYWSMES